MTFQRYLISSTAAALAVVLLTAGFSLLGIGAAVITVLVLAAAAFAVVYTAYGFTAPMFGLVHNLTDQIAQGDLSGGLERLDFPGEFGHLCEGVRRVCKGMIKHLGRIVQNIGILENNAEQIKSGIDQIVAGGRVQTGSIKEILERVEAYAATNREITDLSRRAEELSVETGGMAVQGAQKILEVREMIKNIETQVQTVGQAAEHIGETVGLIADISRQTNFLALSAAIEAARAGAYGKGFVMVAGQVARLAEGAGQSTTEITEIMGGVFQGVAATEVAVRDGLAVLQRFEAAFADIRGKAEAALVIAKEVRARLDIQGQTVGSVVENVRSIARVAEETGAAAESVGSLTGEIGRVAERFRVVSDTYRI